MAFRTPPTPEYERDIKKLEAHYKKALKEVTKLLVKLDPKDTLRASLYNSLLRQITFIIDELNNKSREWLETTLTEAYEQGIANSLVSMGIAKDILQAKGSQEFSLISRNRVEAMIADTFRDVLKATTFMENTLKRRVRELQAEVLRQNTILQRGTVTSAKGMKQRLLAEGFLKSLVEENWKGIIDASGRRWDLTTYTSMVARTKLQQAHIEGVTQTALENGSDLAVISSHGAKDACRNFEGLIISLTGRTKGYRTLAELRNSGLIFHPNCQHSVHAIGDINAFPQSLKQKHGEKESQADFALKNAKEIKSKDNARRYKQKKDDNKN
ncbi:phage minor capsid protein [Neobacillus rhizosphaerae]|uniref:phage minor capsid protein n=1 Tax=Neobacillus rhizosphaerae TaxID=2880965 RepID=UPI003D2D6C09